MTRVQKREAIRDVITLLVVRLFLRPLSLSASDSNRVDAAQADGRITATITTLEGTAAVAGCPGRAPRIIGCDGDC